MIHIDSEHLPGVVAIPSGSLARYNQFWDSLEMLEVPRGTAFLHSAGTANIGRNRNDMIRAMLSMPSLVYQGKKYSKPQWMFFLDDDAEFPAELLVTMLDKLAGYFEEHTVLGSLYMKKQPPFEPVAYTIVSPNPAIKSERYKWVDIALTCAQGQDLPVAGCGASGLLVRRETLEAMGEAGDPDARWFPENMIAEDLGFCRNVYEGGGKVYIQTKYPLGHTEPCTATPEFIDGEWMLNLNWAGRGFRIPANRFHP